MSSIMELIQQEKTKFDAERLQDQQEVKKSIQQNERMQKELEQLDIELFHIINQRLKTKRKPPRASSPEYEDQFSFAKFLDQKQPPISILGQHPSSRREVQILQAWFDMMLNKYYVKEEDWQSLRFKERNLNLLRIHKILDTCLQELVKQTTVICSERGQLLEQALVIYQFLQDKRVQQLRDEKVALVKKQHLDRERLEEEFQERTKSWQMQIDQIDAKFRKEAKENEDNQELIGILRLRVETVNNKQAELMKGCKQRERKIQDLEQQIHHLQIKCQKYKDKKRLLNKKMKEMQSQEQVAQQKKASRHQFIQNLQGMHSSGMNALQAQPMENPFTPVDFNHQRSRVMSMGRPDRIAFAADQSDLDYSQSNGQDITIRKSFRQIRVLDQSSGSNQLLLDPLTAGPSADHSQHNLHSFHHYGEEAGDNVIISPRFENQASQISNHFGNEDMMSQEAFQLIAKDENRFLSMNPDEEDTFIRKQIETHQLQEEMIKNRDFQYILSRIDELCYIYRNQLPESGNAGGKGQKMSEKQNDFIKEIIKQLFKNEIEIISKYSQVFFEKQQKLMQDSFTENTGRSSGGIGGLRRNRQNSISNAIYLNNPNYTKRKMVVHTYDIAIQTEESMLGQKMSEAEIENKVASRLIQMLISKGVTKIIKKYGYLPIDYINKHQGKSFDQSMDTSGLSSKGNKSASKSPHVVKYSPHQPNNTSQ